MCTFYTLLRTKDFFKFCIKKIKRRKNDETRHSQSIAALSLCLNTPLSISISRFTRRELNLNHSIENQTFEYIFLETPTTKTGCKSIFCVFYESRHIPFEPRSFRAERNRSVDVANVRQRYLATPPNLVVRHGCTRRAHPFFLSPPRSPRLSLRIPEYASLRPRRTLPSLAPPPPPRRSIRPRSPLPV